MLELADADSAALPMRQTPDHPKVRLAKSGGVR